MIKVLKETSSNFKELEKLNEFLNKKQIELHQTVYNGIIYYINGKFYKYYIEGKYVECDENGNTDYYQK